MTYVIKEVFAFRSQKDGRMVDETVYFERHNNMVLSFNVMTSKIEEAKRYEFKTEAHREKRKYFGNQKGVTVIKTEQ